MTRSLSKNRARAAAIQGHRCYYCGLPIWNQDSDAFARRYALSAGQLKQLQCTAEHISARCDGGKDTADNIVAACTYCNQHRHRRAIPLPASEYKHFVLTRMKHKRWLAANMTKRLMRARRI